MTSIEHYTTVFLLTLVIIISISNVVLTNTCCSPCSCNKNSTCAALPFNINNTPDVWLHVPNLSVQEISLVVKDIKAHVSLSADVAGLVAINAGVDISIDTVNLTILGVNAEVQLAVYLNNVATIVTRVMASLDLNPLLTSVIDGVVQTVNKALATFTQNGKLIRQIIEGGKIINQVLDAAGQVLSSSDVGDYSQNMTLTGVTQTLDNGNIIKQYSYPPPAGSSQSDNILVNIVFDPQGKVLSSTVVNPASSPTTTSTPVTAVSTTTTTTIVGPTAA